MSQLRRQGLGDFKQVRTANMESDGQISIIPYEQPRERREKTK